MRLRGPQPLVVIERSGDDLRIIAAPPGLIVEIHDYDTPEDGRPKGPVVTDPETLELFELVFLKAPRPRR